MDRKLLLCKGITKKFPGVVALDNIDFDLDYKEIHAVVGENGAGKSTLMKILMGVNKNDNGEIFLNNKKIEIMNTSQAINYGINMIFQEFNLIPNLNAIENIFLGIEFCRKIPWFIDFRKSKGKTKRVLDELGIAINTGIPIKYLSTPNKQIVEIAKSVVRKSRILIMDEPTASLTPKEVERLFNLMINLKESGMSIIFVTHRIEEIFRVSDRVTVFRDGKKIITKRIQETNLEEIINKMTGRDLINKKYFFNLESKNEVLKVEDLYVDNLLNKINLKLFKGEILGITGLLGSGKSELARTLFGLEKVNSGRIFILGKEVKINSPDDAIKQGIGYLPEDRKELGLILKMMVKENITLASLSNLVKLGFINFKKEKELVLELKNKLDIDTSDINKQIQFLSGGNQQKAVISKWLLTNSKILIFDEPTRGIDVGAKEKIYQIMNELIKNTDLSIIVFSSEFDEILKIANRIYLMRKGEIIAEHRNEGITKEKLMQYVSTGGKYE
ncbi:MAG: sugar ABC transporter ATP-binding protein [Actinobacteria bacterium]|nr:sugar ABC transporter ATP-binding protein [Actinomycetota bacterium]